MALPWPCLGFFLALPWPILGLFLVLPWPFLDLALTFPWPSTAVQCLSQGGYVYAYGLSSMLNAPGEYHVDRQRAKLSFVPPEGAGGGSYSVSRLDSVVIADGVTDVSFEGKKTYDLR